MKCRFLSNLRLLPLLRETNFAELSFLFFDICSRSDKNGPLDIGGGWKSGFGPGSAGGEIMLAAVDVRVKGFPYCSQDMNQIFRLPRAVRGFGVLENEEFPGVVQKDFLLLPLFNCHAQLYAQKPRNVCYNSKLLGFDRSLGQFHPNN
jgi:hypothetical protein